MLSYILLFSCLAGSPTACGAGCWSASAWCSGALASGTSGPGGNVSRAVVLTPRAWSASGKRPMDRWRRGDCRSVPGPSSGSKRDGGFYVAIPVAAPPRLCPGRPGHGLGAGRLAPWAFYVLVPTRVFLLGPRGASSCPNRGTGKPTPALTLRRARARLAPDRHAGTIIG